MIFLSFTHLCTPVVHTCALPIWALNGSSAAYAAPSSTTQVPTESSSGWPMVTLSMQACMIGMPWRRFSSPMGGGRQRPWSRTMMVTRRFPRKRSQEVRRASSRLRQTPRRTANCSQPVRIRWFGSDRRISNRSAAWSGRRDADRGLGLRRAAADRVQAGPTAGRGTL
jgi:hypothetical protein